MCLIIEKPKDLDLHDGLLVSAYENNPDGFGIMFPLGAGKVHVHRTMPKSYEEIYPVYTQYKNKHCALHFRLATHGAKDKSQCHPYKIFSMKRGDDFDMYLMHNGIITMPEIDKSKSDTWHFVEYFLQPILIQNPDIIYNETFVKAIGKLLVGNRVLILDGRSGEFIKLADSGSHTADDGIWYSNTYSTKRGTGPEFSIIMNESYGGYTDRDGNWVPVNIPKRVHHNYVSVYRDGRWVKVPKTSYGYSAYDAYGYDPDDYVAPPYGTTHKASEATKAGKNKQGNDNIEDPNEDEYIKFWRDNYYGTDVSNVQDDTKPYGTTCELNENIEVESKETEDEPEENLKLSKKLRKVIEGGEINPLDLQGMDAAELQQVYEHRPYAVLKLLEKWVN